MIVCRSHAELEKMRAAGKLVGLVMTTLATKVAPGVTTADLDAIAEGLIVDADGHLREQRCCPSCQSTISGPPTSLRVVLDSLRQQSQVTHLSLAFLTEIPAALLRP